MTAPADQQTQRVSYALPAARPVVTWILLSIIAVVFLVETAAGGSTNTEVLVRLGANVTALVAAGEYWRLFTSMFLHIGAMHLFFNGYALVAVGTEVERIYGSLRFLAIYLLAGLFGSLASYAFSFSVSAGASGAIFGLIGALAAFYMLHRQRLGKSGQRRLANIAFLIAINLFLGFTQPGIDNMAHLGGLLSGFALGWVLAPRYQLDRVSLRVVDRNRLTRYWPALGLAVLLFIGGVALTTSVRSNSPAARVFRARDAIEREAWDEAVADLEQAIVEDPNLVDAYFYLGLARNHLGQPRLAAEAYESALALETDFSSAHWNLALTYLDLERYADAQAQFEVYVELNPDAGSDVQPYLDEIRRSIP